LTTRAALARATNGKKRKHHRAGVLVDIDCTELGFSACQDERCVR